MKEKSSIVVISERERIITPMVPNFLKMEDGRVLDIMHFSPDELKLVAEAWAHDLQENAKRRKRNP